MKNLKLCIDALLCALLMLLMAYQVTGEVLHEWFGVAIDLALIVHHVLNRKWSSSLFKGRYTAYRIVLTAVNTLLLASIALTAICGMAMSTHALPFLYGLLPVSFARQFHLAMSYWSFILMGLHLGLHVPAMTAKLGKRTKAALAAVAAVVACAGLWVFAQSGIVDYIRFRTPFAYLDYDKPAALVFAENLSMMTLFAFIGGACARVLRKSR